jgi:PAS domain S-box-containing protein
MFVICLTIVSVLIQLAATYLSLRLIYITRKHISWAFIAMAMVLQASRRVNTVYGLINGTIISSQVAISEYIGLVVSVLMLLGVIGIASFLKKSERSLIKQKLSEEKLLESESKFKKLYENGPFGMVLVNKELKFTSANPTFIEMLGYSEEELHNFTFQDITHSDDIEVNLQNIRKLMIQEISVYKTEKRFIRKDGQVIWGSLTVTSNYSTEGKFLYNLGIIEDITSRKNVEEELLASKIKLETALSSMTDAIFISDVEGNFIEFNDAFATFHKFKNKQECTKTFAEYPEFLDVYMSNGELAPIEQWAVPRALRGEIVKNAEYSLRRKDTGESWVGSYSFAPILDSNGKIVGSVVAGRDITEQKHSEEAIRERESLLNDMGKIAHIGGWEFSPITGKASWTEEVANIHDIDPGLPTSVLSGINYYHEDSKPIIAKAVNDVVEFAKSYDLELEIVSAKGIQKWIRTIGHPVIENGKVVKVHGSLQNITERKLKDIALRESEENFRMLNETLELNVTERTTQLLNANKELEAFSYSVSHDLRAPLRHISGFVDLLSNKYRDLLPETGKHYLKVINDSSQRMGILIDDLLQFSRTGRQEMHQSNLDMNIVLHEVKGLIQADIKERKVDWEIAQLPLITGDHSLLRMVWFNLLSNAVKFTREKETAKIEIGFKEEGTEYVFFIRDNGAGFDMRYANKLFGVFQRLHSQQEFEGTGIGLANVRRIILKHGGRTWAESKPDDGATFYFTLSKSTEKNGGV